MSTAYLRDSKNYLYLFALLLNLLILRVSIPYLEYLFLLLALGLIPAFVLNYKEVFGNFSKYKHFRSASLFFIIIFVFCFAYLKTSQHIFLINRELAVALFSFFYLSAGFLLIRNSDQIKIFTKNVINQFILITFIAALLGMIKFSAELAGIKFGFLFNSIYPVGTSLKSDHNFFALSMLIAFILVFYKTNKNERSKSIFFIILLTSYTISILFSSSRRAILVLSIIHFFLFVKIIYHLLRKKKCINVGRYLLLVGIVSIIAFLTFYQYRTSNRISFSNKQKISLIINDYRSILFKNSNLSDSYQLIWGSNYLEDNKQDRYKQFLLQNNSETKALVKNSASNWKNWLLRENKLHDIENNQILEISGFNPRACIYQFFFLDSIIQPLQLTMNLKAARWNKNQKIEVRWEDKTERFSIPESFNDGKWHPFNISIPEIGNTRMQLLIYCAGYNIEDEGQLFLNDIVITRGISNFQKNIKDIELLNNLKLPEPIQNEFKPITLNIPSSAWKNNFKYIDSTQFNNQQILLSYVDTVTQKAYQNIVIPTTQYYMFSAKLYSCQNNSTKRLYAYNKTRKNYLDVPSNNKSKVGWVNLKLIFYAEKNDTLTLGLQKDKDTAEQLIIWKEIKLKSINPFEKEIEVLQNKNDIDTTELTKFFVTKKDSIQYITHQALPKNKFLSERTDRWNYALELYYKCSFLNKLFGSGFDYLIKFRHKFKIDNQEFDYPHNIFLSTLLYSGIIGLFLLLFLLAQVIYLYIKYKSYILLISYLLTLNFVFFSSNSIFELPLFIGFIIIPYLHHMIKKKEA